MKLKIRQNVFETNSSSMHSLVVKNTEDEYETHEEIASEIFLDEGTWSIWDEDDLTFGRAPFKCLATFRLKTCYVIACLCGYCMQYDSKVHLKNAEEKFGEIMKIVHEVYPECKNIELPIVTMRNKRKPYDVTFYGYVDEDILTPFLKEEGISLKEFLTNKKYFVIVDGDEYCIWNNIKKTGVINKNMIAREYEHGYDGEGVTRYEN